MEETIRFTDRFGQDTLPAICEEPELQTCVPVCSAGMYIGDWELTALMSCTKQSELWFANDPDDYLCVVKVSSRADNSEVIERIRLLDCPNLAQVLDCGWEGGFWYEVYPFYRGGCLHGKYEEDLIRKTILPGLISALAALHSIKIMHNDIKPQNIFWDEDRETVILGDFGCAAPANTRPAAFTPSYAALEILLRDGCSRASDWCSVGLTLAALVSGKPLLQTNSAGEAMLAWERGLRFQDASGKLKQLINGMIQSDPRKRLGPGAATKWCNEAAFGAEGRVSAREEDHHESITITFENPDWIAADIDTLLSGIVTHWDHSVFLFQQAKMDRFLSQFDKKWVDVCKKLRNLPSAEDALFRLTLELTGKRSFIWRGALCRNLLDLETVWEEENTGEEDTIAFLQRGHVVYYLRTCGAEPRQIAFAGRLQEVSRVNPEEAIIQLFAALHGNDGLSWGNAVFENIRDLIDWLGRHTDTLDNEVSSMFESKRFGAWFAYQGMEHVLDDIRRRTQS